MQESALPAALQTRSMIMITDRTRHFSSTVILYSGNCAPCRMLTRIIRNWQQYTAVRHALRLLERNRLHRRPRLRRGHFPRHSRSSRWRLTMNPDRSSTAISREMREVSRSLLIRFLRSERSSRRSLQRSLRSTLWITNYMSGSSRRSLRLWTPASG